jgi:secondary thiamine-phosphate synthase enzyme
MHQASGTLSVTAPRQGLHLITEAVAAWVARQDIAEGLLTLFIQHTSASLLIQENAAPAARRDLERWLARLAPESREYEHDEEGPDDMPAHLRSVLTTTSLSIPVLEARMRLGTWQGIYLCEHRREPTPREIALHLLGT